MFSATVLDHFAKPHNMGAIAEADVVGSEGFPGEGPHMAIYLCLAREGARDDRSGEKRASEERVSEERAGYRICEARFETYGCPAAIACGSWLTQWVVGKTLATAGAIEAEELSIAVGGLPLGKEHCAELAINALRRALRKVHN